MNFPKAHKLGQIRSSEIRRKPENTKVKLQGTPMAKALKINTSNSTVTSVSDNANNIKPASDYPVRQSAIKTYVDKPFKAAFNSNSMPTRLNTALPSALSANKPSKLPYIQPSPITLHLPPGIQHIPMPGAKSVNVNLPLPSQPFTAEASGKPIASSNPTIVVYIPPPIITAPLMSTSPPSAAVHGSQIQTPLASSYGTETVTLPSVTLPTINLPTINLPTFPPLTMPPSFEKILHSHTTETPSIYRPYDEPSSDEDGAELLFSQKRRKPKKKVRKNAKKKLQREKLAQIQDENTFVDSEDTQLNEVSKFPAMLAEKNYIDDSSSFSKSFDGDNLANNNELPKYVNEENDDEKLFDTVKSWTVSYKDV
uniref:Uncharacterized protein n=1 Tax=Syphacia muris TaxID=451379 RepID=A0A0N5ANL9_9BILA